ncbi:dynein axonemal intermediate chain 7 [Engraulis encrasicolus]|uniref:dynein axonemal intermediate chain 7 n=1 Tax=Engraulis encrasicolus TaxID=184585 RepID=UPI002FD3335B
MSAAKKKGGKVAKAEKEKLQKEEDERKQKEEDEARQAAEREEQERRERLRLEQEEQERLEMKDRERREDELNELRHLLEENHIASTKWEAELKGKAKWDRYMRCDGSPDPSVLQEINTFISLWWEDTETQVEPVLQQCDQALQLIEELEALIGDDPEPQQLLQYKDTMVSLQKLLHTKHNLITEHILKLANTQSDIETGNMQTVVRDKNITLCLWANLNKNPRFKGFDFQEVRLGFRLPKQLAVSDVAVRMLHTRYDHLSHLSRPTPPRSRSSFASLAAAGDQDPTATATPQGEGEGEREGEVGQRASTLAADDADRHSLKSESRKSVMSVHSNKDDRKSSSRKTAVEESGTGTGTGTGPEDTHTMLETVHSGVTISPPPEDSSALPDSAVGSVVDLHQFSSLGGVFYFDAFHLPPQAHALNGWEMRQLLDSGLQVFPYPLEQLPVNSFASGRLDESVALCPPPVGASVTLPDSVVVLEDPTVARWDPTDKHWKTDCISDVVYSASERCVSFSMDSFCIFTLMQDSYCNMPFQSWELRPLAQDSAMLTIHGALLQVSITIKGNQCMVRGGDEEGEGERVPADLTGQWMSAAALQKAMRNAGINIFTDQHSDKYVSVNAKDPLIEHAVYEQMALLSSAVAFSWSKWNAQCGQQHLVLQVCEHLDERPVDMGAWSLYLLGAQRSQRLAMSEGSPAFSPQLAPGTEFHSTFLHMLRDVMSEASNQRVRSSHHLYVETVQSLLSATRVLTYS